MEFHRCERCGRELESSIKPEKCPCGSEEIEQKERKSKLEQIIEKYLSKS